MLCLTWHCLFAFVCLQGIYLPGFTPTPDEPQISYGLQRLDHAVGNVHKLVEALEHIIGFTGTHSMAAARPQPCLTGCSLFLYQLEVRRCLQYLIVL